MCKQLQRRPDVAWGHLKDTHEYLFIPPAITWVVGGQIFSLLLKLRNIKISNFYAFKWVAFVLRPLVEQFYADKT